LALNLRGRASLCPPSQLLLGEFHYLTLPLTTTPELRPECPRKAYSARILALRYLLAERG